MAKELKPPNTGTSRLSLIPHSALAAHHCGLHPLQVFAPSISILAVAEGGHWKVCTSSVLLLGFCLGGEGFPSSSVSRGDGSKDFAVGITGNTVTDLLQAGS